MSFHRLMTPCRLHGDLELLRLTPVRRMSRRLFDGVSTNVPLRCDNSVATCDTTNGSDGGRLSHRPAGEEFSLYS
jgi:hypothetical protein